MKLYEIICLKLVKIIKHYRFKESFMQKVLKKICINQNYNKISPHTGQNGHHQKNLQTINAGEDMEKREPSCTVGENVNLHSHYGEQYVYSLKNKDYDPGTPLPYDPAIPLLSHFSRV